jgi:hypothetical protein
MILTPKRIPNSAQSDLPLFKSIASFTISAIVATPVRILIAPSVFLAARPAFVAHGFFFGFFLLYLYF